jgi:acyl carrier protein
MTVPTEDALRHWLIERLAAIQEVDPASVDPAEPFSAYGLGSRDAVGLAGELEEWLGRELSPALLYDYPSIDVLARHLVASRDAGDVQ